MSEQRSPGQQGPAVKYELRGDVAVLTVASPPVNALSEAVRNGLDEGFRRAAADAKAKAVVLTGEGKVFIAGADIKTLGKPRKGAMVPDIIAFVETMQKPVVAAIQGQALGGGLEVALACHARVARPECKLGLPEVTLGLIPGAGGTQRMPRLIGGAAALDLIAGGKPVSADKARQLGFIDAVAAGDVAEASIARAKELLATGELPRCRDRRTPDDAAAREAFDKLAGEYLVKSRGSEAVQAAIEAVKATFGMDFDAGLKHETALFRGLLEGDAAKAMIHAFLAERASAHVRGVDKSTSRRNIRKVSVIGAGTMGGGIAMTYANAGYAVTLIETAEAAIEAARKRIFGVYAGSVERGSMPAAEAEKAKARFSWSTDFAAGIADADLVIEAVFEDMGLKKRIFRDLEKYAKPGAILASNTSYQNIDEMAAETTRPDSVIGMHYFSPANVMPLLEVVRGKATSPETLATVLDAARATKKTPVVVGVCYGFVGNRMLWQRTLESQALLLEGNKPSAVDKVLIDFGFKMGPLQMADLAGVDVGWRLRKANNETLEPADSIAEAGRWGQKTAKGYYLYPQGSRSGVEDPEAQAIIAQAAQRLGVAQRPSNAQEMLYRMIFPMINEGARILDEGHVERASDIDVIYLRGYNWPRHRGGPMWYADQVGLPVIVRELERLVAATGRKHLEPSPLLRRLAAEGKSFLALDGDK